MFPSHDPEAEEQGIGAVFDAPNDAVAVRNFNMKRKTNEAVKYLQLYRLFEFKPLNMIKGKADTYESDDDGEIKVLPNYVAKVELLVDVEEE